MINILDNNNMNNTSKRQSGLATKRWNVVKKSREQSNYLEAFYEEQLLILNNMRNSSNAKAIEMVTNIFLIVR